MSTSNDLIGRTVGGGRYRLDKLLGVGATGKVYLGEQLSLARPVAVKVLRAELAADRDLTERFREEALLAAKLSHPNIAAVIDCSEPDDDVAFIAMEYVCGKNLYRLLESEFPLEIRRAVDLFGQILGGLEEAHEAGIVHADVKTPNVVVSQTHAGDEQPKIVDFGIAVLRPPAGRSAAGVVCGTPEYLAPELIKGQAPSVASDIYGAGIILYELLAGEPPFSGVSLSEILHKHLEVPVPSLPVAGPAEVVCRLDAIIGRALAKEPERRFRSVSEFRAAVVAASSLHVAEPSAALMTILPRHRRPKRPPTAPAGTDDGGEMPTLDARMTSHLTIRARLDRAIRTGDPTEIGEAYLMLAGAVGATDAGAAVRELEEALDVVSGVGRDGRRRGGMEVVGRLGLALARHRERAANRAGAVEAALRALFYSQRINDIEGCVRAHELLERLYTADGHFQTAARHRETRRRLVRRMSF